MKRVTALTLLFCILFCLTAQMHPEASASVFEHSESYRSSEYYQRLLSTALSGKSGADIAAVALSQVGYHEGRSAGDLDGTSSGKANFTEYGANFGLSDDAWCSIFVWWCARQAGVNESIIRKTEWAKTSLQPFACLPLSQCGNISVGDIAFIDMSGGDGIEDHMGIVVAVSENEITTVEGNSSNAVRRQVYSRTTGLRSDSAGTLLYIGSPDYGGVNSPVCTYETIFVHSPNADAYSAIGGEKIGTLGDGEYMLLATDSTGSWLQLVAANGTDSVFISADNADLSAKNLPPITGYDAWSTFEPHTTAAVSDSNIAIPIQTDPSVTTTAPTSATSSTAPSATQSSVSSAITPTESDNGYTASFGNDWIEYAAYGLLGLLTLGFIVVMASLMGKKESSADDY